MSSARLTDPFSPVLSLFDPLASECTECIFYELYWSLFVTGQAKEIPQLKERTRERVITLGKVLREVRIYEGGNRFIIVSSEVGLQRNTWRGTEHLMLGVSVKEKGIKWYWWWVDWVEGINCYLTGHHQSMFVFHAGMGLGDSSGSTLILIRVTVPLQVHSFGMVSVTWCLP